MDSVEKICFGINDATIEYINKALEAPKIDIELMVSSQLRNLPSTISRIIGLLHDVDCKKLVSRQSFIFKLTGADIEERLKFELAARIIIAEIEKLEKVQISLNAMAVKLNSINTALSNRQIKIRKIIESGKQALKSYDSDDLLLRDRFERKLSNLITTETASQMSIEQFKISKMNVETWQDRITEMVTILFPAWQQNAFTLLQSDMNSIKSPMAQSFLNSQEKLIAKLSR